MNIINIILNLDLNCMNIVWGLLGSAILIGDVMKINTKKIIMEAGTYAAFDPVETIKKHLETRYNTASAGILLILSYTASLVNAAFSLKPKIDTICISVVIALIIGLIIKYCFDQYVQRKIEEVVTAYKVNEVVDFIMGCSGQFTKEEIKNKARFNEDEKFNLFFEKAIQDGRISISDNDKVMYNSSQ